MKVLITKKIATECKERLQKSQCAVHVYIAGGVHIRRCVGTESE